MATASAVEVVGVSKRYDGFTAVDNISFSVAAGEIFGFLGPNGAGKTTLIRMLTTLLTPSSGQARVAGHDVVSDSDAVRCAIGVVPQAMTSDLDLTGRENMDIYGRFYSIANPERRQRIEALLAMVGLAERADELVAAYSGGMRRRLEIARALIHRPRILFLDEPTIGLDPQSRRVIWEFIRGRLEEERMTIFLTTHYMDEAEELCHRVAIIDSGTIIALGETKALKAQIPGQDVISFRVEPLNEQLSERLSSLAFVHKLAIEDSLLRIFVDNGAENLPGLIEAVKAQGSTVLSATIHQQSLEDVFIHFTGKSIRQEETKKVNFLVGAGIPQKWGR